MDEKQEIKLNKPLLGVAFGLYLIVLIWVLIFKCADILTLSSQYTVTHATAPLDKTFLLQFHTQDYGTPNGILGIFIMFIMFVPFGIFLPLLSSKDYYFLRDLVIMVFVTFVIELIQWLSRFGVISFIDYIVEMVGFLIGSILYKFVVEKYMNNKAINIANLVFSIIMLPIALYGVIITGMRYDLYTAYYPR